MNPRTGLDDVEKRRFLTVPGLELRPLGRPAVASRYTDYAIPAPGGVVRTGFFGHTIGVSRVFFFFLTQT
jgi:hypothetical protein